MRPSLVPALAFLTWCTTASIATPVPIPPSPFHGASFHQTIPSKHSTYKSASPLQPAVHFNRTRSGIITPKPHSHSPPAHLIVDHHRARQFHDADYGTNSQPSPIPEDAPAETTTTATPATQAIQATSPLAHTPSQFASSPTPIASPASINDTPVADNYPREEQRHQQPGQHIESHYIHMGHDALNEPRGISDGAPDASSKVDNIKSQLQGVQNGVPTVPAAATRELPVDACGGATPHGRQHLNVGISDNC